MKFTDGNWLLQPGVRANYATEVHDVAAEGSTLVVHAPTRPIRHRGDTLDGSLLTIRLSSPLHDVVRVRIEHFAGAADRGPHIPLMPAEPPEVAITMGEDEAVLTSGRLSARVRRKGGWDLAFTDGDRAVTRSASRGAAYVQWAGKGNFVHEQLTLAVGECVYGLGERFTAFVKNGQVVETWNEDGGTGCDQAYKSVPFYLTNRGYGVLVNEAGPVSFEVASEKVSRVQFSIPGESLDYFVIYGPDPKDVLRKLSALTGRPALPPAWSFGLWLSTSFTTNYDEATVTSFIEGMKSRDLPLHVFHFDCFWMREFNWCDLQWDTRTFPDPAGMLRRLHERGLQDFGVDQSLHRPVFPPLRGGPAPRLPPEEAQRRGVAEGPVAAGHGHRRLYQPGGEGVVRRPSQASRRNGCRLLQDGFRRAHPHRRRLPRRLRPGEDAQLLPDRLQRDRVLHAREDQGRRGGHRVRQVGVRHRPAVPGALGRRLLFDLRIDGGKPPGGLSFGICGFGFWSHDIGGFEGQAPAAVYKRWVAFGLLSSHSRLHGSSSYRVPWNYDDEACDVLRFFTKLKCRLMPYLFGAAVQAHREGIPVMRAMALEFPRRPACDTLDRQYMLGGSILVAPVFSEDGLGRLLPARGTVDPPPHRRGPGRRQMAPGPPRVSQPAAPCASRNRAAGRSGRWASGLRVFRRGHLLRP